MNNIFDIWEQVLNLLKQQLSQDMVDWLMANVLPVQLQDNTLVIHVAKPFLKTWLESNLLDELTNACSSILGTTAHIHITLPQNNENVLSQPTEKYDDHLPRTSPSLKEMSQQTSSFTLPEVPIPDLTPVVEKNIPTTPISESQSFENHTHWKHIPFNEQYTFDNFIVGNSNHMAKAAAMSVAQNPAQRQNPLFIYGPSGLGKTHLMHAICNYVRQHTPEKNIVFLSSEDFLINFISSLQQNRLDYNRAFREKYRTVDYILIDDVQFFGEGGKETTKIEFFHTFNELLNHQKQIVMTCDRLPENMRNLEERLISRFQSGLVVEIKPSDFEMRCAYLKNCALQENLDLSWDVVKFIAENFDENFRHLEGIFTTIYTFSSMQSKPITLDMVREILADRLPKLSKPILSADMILSEVAAFYKIKYDKLVGKSRPKNIAYPRQIAMFLCREMLDLPFSQIGKLFNRDHTTVLYAYEKIYTEMAQDYNLKENIKEIKSRLQ